MGATAGAGTLAAAASFATAALRSETDIIVTSAKVMTEEDAPTMIRLAAAACRRRRRDNFDDAESIASTEATGRELIGSVNG
jgi:hypothetical protein